MRTQYCKVVADRLDEQLEARADCIDDRQRLIELVVRHRLELTTAPGSRSWAKKKRGNRR